MAALIEASELCFGYGNKTVLRDVSLQVHRGEFVAIIGPNGSGKTTLLKLLTRVLRPQRGRIALEGHDYAHISARQLARRIAVAPQETPVLFPFSVTEVVLMGRAPYLPAFGFETHEDLEQARRAMEQTDVLHLADRAIGSLSSGEKQRAIIARALAQQPEILLLDEPTSSLDIKHQIDVYELLTGLNAANGLTVVIVSHDLNMAAQYARRMVLLREGTLYRDGPPGEVITRESIRKVYGAEVAIEYRGEERTPFVLPMRRGGRSP